MRTILFFLLLSTLATATLMAQPTLTHRDPRPFFGILGGGQWSYHASDFRRLYDVPNCCPRFIRADGWGVYAGLAAEFPLSEAFFLQVRGLYQKSSVSFSPVEAILFNWEGEAVPGLVEHALTIERSSVGLQPVVGYHLTRTLSVFGGVDIGAVLSTSYDQKELLRQPENTGTFENQQRVRNPYSGTLPKALAYMGSLVAGLRIDVPLDARGVWWARPELSGLYGVTPVASDMTWREHALRLGVAIMVQPLSAPPVAPAPPPVVPPPITPPPPVASCSITAMGIDPDGSEQPRGRIRIEEFVTSQMRPLLSYIFFDENSSDLPSRYRLRTAKDGTEYSMNGLRDAATLDIYHDVLNIVGARLRATPQAVLTITGCNADVGIEKHQRVLSRARAETVRQYLRDVWAIPESRLRLEIRNLPSMPSITSDPDGIAENRRVELSATHPEILDPLTFGDTIQVIQPPVIRFTPSLVTTLPVREWTLAVLSGSDTVRLYQSVGGVPPQILWDLREEPRTRIQQLRSLRYVLIASTAGGPVARCEGDLPVDQITVRAKRGEGVADTETDRYDLILFDFNRTDLNARNRRIAESIRTRIQPTSRVSVTGFTDRVGEESFNLRLSEDRARETAAFLRRSDARVTGKGESSLYPNDLPEGRFYNRTVSIVVETPIR